MLGPDLHLGVVEHHVVAGLDVHRADAQPGVAAVDAVEVDQFQQRVAQRRGVVEAQRLGRAGRGQGRPEQAGPEEARRAEGGDVGRAHLVHQRAAERDVGTQGREEPARGGALPELAHRRDALAWLVAGDDGGVDGADGDAGDPGRAHALASQALAHPALIRSQRATALQHQHRPALTPGRGRRDGGAPALELGRRQGLPLGRFGLGRLGLSRPGLGRPGLGRLGLRLGGRLSRGLRSRLAA